MKLPDKNCILCPRLKLYRKKLRKLEPSWFNSPVQSFGSIKSKLLIVGLAPGIKGANRTGRPFTGDYAGKLLYSSLLKYSFANGKYLENRNDSLKLVNCRITNSVRCVPPQNKPTIDERNTCRKFLESEIQNMSKLKIILALGQIAHSEILKIFNKKISEFQFGHGTNYNLTNTIAIYSSYHCSRYNTQTNRLTETMFHKVIENIKLKILT